MNVSLINYVSHSLIAFFIWLYSLKNQNLIFFFSIVKLVGQLLCSVFGLLLPILIGCLFCSQIRLVVEEGLNQLPYSECTVTTPTGEPVTMVITPLPSPLPFAYEHGIAAISCWICPNSKFHSILLMQGINMRVWNLKRETVGLASWGVVSLFLSHKVIHTQPWWKKTQPYLVCMPFTLKRIC